MSLVVAVRMLVEVTADALRPFDLSREDAADLLGKYPPMRKLRELDDATAEEVLALVLQRFSPAEPPAVPGLDFLPAVEADAQVLVAESVAALDEPKPAAPNVLLDATIAALPEPKPGQQYVDFEGDRWQVQSDGTLLWLDTKNISDRQAGLTKPNLLHLAKDWGPLTAGPLVEVQPRPAPEVWDDSVPPGGFVCSVCRTPVESEPCELHGEAVES